MVKRFDENYEFFKQEISSFRRFFTRTTLKNNFPKKDLEKIWDLVIHHRDDFDFSSPFARSLKAQLPMDKSFKFQILKMVLPTKHEKLIQFVEDEKNYITGGYFLLFANNFSTFENFVSVESLIDSATLDAICTYYSKEKFSSAQVKYHMERLKYISFATLNVFDKGERKELFENAIKSWEIKDPTVCDLIEMTPELYYLLINEKRTSLLQYVLENGRIMIESSQYLTCWLKVRDRKTAARTGWLGARACRIGPNRAAAGRPPRR
jgi:hypothetical protein